jgi:hypothetical protein
VSLGGLLGRQGHRDPERDPSVLRELPETVEPGVFACVRGHEHGPGDDSAIPGILGASQGRHPTAVPYRLGRDLAEASAVDQAVNSARYLRAGPLRKFRIRERAFGAPGGEGRIRAGGVDKEVSFVAETDPAVNDQIDAVYRASTTASAAPTSAPWLPQGRAKRRSSCCPAEEHDAVCGRNHGPLLIMLSIFPNGTVASP